MAPAYQLFAARERRRRAGHGAGDVGSGFLQVLTELVEARHALATGLVDLILRGVDVPRPAHLLLLVERLLVPAVLNVILWSEAGTPGELLASCAGAHVGLKELPRAADMGTEHGVERRGVRASSAGLAERTMALRNS